MRIAWIAACALALGGCNFVYSERPMFGVADAGLRLRPGVWMKPEKDCAFDRAQPVKAWPECAGGMIVTPTRMVDPAKPDKVIDYLIVAGEPPVVQVPFTNDVKQTVWLYAGMRASRRDDQGRVVELRTWIAQCGPPPPKPRPDDPHPRYVTDHPLPGLTIDEKTGMCLAKAPGPVRASVKASEAWDDSDKSAAPAAWVRDGEE